MICYKDMTFCVNPNCTCPDYRKLTDEVRTAAGVWWGGPGAPISMGDCCGATEEDES